MAMINGVLGPIDTADLGFVLMHEHIFNANSAMRLAFDRWVDEEAGIRRAVAELRAAAERGVRTVVDATPINLGRDVHILRKVAEQAPMQIVAATGLYYNEEPWMGGWEADRLVEFLIGDIQQGIQGTDTRAGIIKCATDKEGVTPGNEKLLRVAARLHRATGVPITTHTDVGAKVGTAQQDVLEDEGVDLARVIIGHCGDSDDLDYLESILERGSMIGMDRFGVDTILSTDKRVAVIAELCRRGWAERMVLSHDACCTFDWYPADLFETARKQVVPNWNFRHIAEDVLPALSKAGVSDEQIDLMTSGNPRRYFEAG